MTHKWFSALLALLSLHAAPALATPCKTQGNVDAAMPFPTSKPTDVPFARSMVPVILPNVSGALPHALRCTRATVSAAPGDYVIGGENDEPFPRMALRADGKPGPVVYLAGSPAAPGIFALVVHQGALTVIKRFYAGIPTDAWLSDDIRAALADNDGVMSFDASRRMVLYSFARPDGSVAPPPLERGAGGVASGPQIFIPAAADPRLLDAAHDNRHKPSGFACPESFDGLAVLLMSIEPHADSLTCDYRAGTELRYREDDPIRYQISLVKAARGDTSQSVFNEMVAQARSEMHITGDHVPPLPTGPSPAPQFVAYWDTADAGVQGVWVAKAGGWIIWVRAQYPPGAANDAEAGKVARTLFDRVAAQVR